jgi:hypothetical protein
MGKSEVSRKRETAGTSPAAAKTVVWEVLQLTGRLIGDLKNVQVAYIRAGVKLADVRDRKLYLVLHHPDLVSYADARLDLGKTSLYRYLFIHDWIAKFHPAWLDPKPKGFIPDLSDIADLIWIEQRLARGDLKPKARAELEEMRAKALDGRLRKGELSEWRRRGRPADDALKSYLSKLRFLRMRGSQLASLPAEVLTHLDAAIEALKNAVALRLVGIDLSESVAGGRGGVAIFRRNLFA